MNKQYSSKLYQKLLDQPDNHDLAFNDNDHLLRLEVELENGTKVYITPKPSDEPFRLATEFCSEHNLDNDMIDVLAQSIQKSIGHSQQSFQKQIDSNCKLIPPDKSKRINFQSNSCKTNNMQKTPQYFSKKSSVNSCLGLYQKGLMLENAKQSWIKRQNQYRIMKEMQQCTHRPKINNLSRSMITEHQTKSKQCKWADNFIDNIKTQKNNQPTFQDIYSIRSSIVVDSYCKKSSIQTDISKPQNDCITSANSIFLKLYEDRKTESVSRSKAQKDLLREHTHHPNINEISKQIVGKVKFNQRLAKYQRQKLMKQENKKRQQIQDKQNMHKPKVGLPPPNRNKEGLPIGDFLYNKKRKTKIQEKICHSPSINQTSQIIYNNKKEDAFSKIFSCLDISKQGMVKWVDLQQIKIDPTIYEILRPLLQEIQIMKIQLNLPDFKTAMNFLFGTLSPTNKNKILNYQNSKEQYQIEPDNYVKLILSKPLFNKKSQQIVSSMSRAKMSIYDFCQFKELEKLQNIESVKIEKQKKEMKQCTFQPTIQKKRLYY